MPRALTLQQGLEEGWYKQNTNQGYCMCECGELAPIAKVSSKLAGTLRGHPRMYINGHNKYRHTEESKRKISEAQLGEKNHWYGKNLPLEARKKMSKAHSGEKCHLWKGGITPEIRAARNSLEYRDWVKSVFERDNYICQECFKRGGILNAHHIKSFALFIDLRYELSNGKTLCEPCHKKLHKKYGYNGYVDEMPAL